MRKIEPLIKLAIPYIVAILCPVIVVIFLCVTMVRDYHGEIVAEKQKNIETSFDNLEKRLKDVEELAFLIGQNEEVSEYVFRNLQGKGNSWIDSAKISELLNDLSVNSDVRFMYMYDAVRNCVITSDEVMSDPMMFFQYKYQPHSYTKEIWKEKLKEFTYCSGYSSSMEVIISGETTRVVEYCIGVPISFEGNSKAYLIVTIDIEEMLDDLCSLVGENGEIYLYRGKTQEIYTNGNQYEKLLPLTGEAMLQKIQGENNLYGAVLKSSDHKWWVELYIPELVPVDMDNPEIVFIWSLMIVTVFVSVIICAYFTFKNHRELGALLNRFKDANILSEDMLHTGEIFSYQNVSGYIEQIIAENTSIKKNLDKMEASQKYKILDRLIRNTYKEGGEIVSLLEGGDVDIWTGNSVVICLKYNNLYYRINISEDLTVKEFVNGLLENLIDGQVELFEASSRETICILPVQNEQNESYLQNIIAKIVVEIVYGYGIDINIGAGNSVESIYQIHDSYVQAKEVIKYREVSGANVHLYSEMKRMKNVYYFSKEMEERFCNYIILGKSDEARDIVGKVYSDNFENVAIKLSDMAIKEISDRFRNGLISVAEKFELYSVDGSSAIESLLSQLERESDVHRVFYFIYEGIEILTDYIVRKNKNDSRQGSAKKIMEYIEKNYCDNMLSVKVIAGELGLHEDYISKLFKKEYGANLSTVIEQRRIAKACELLKTTEMKVSDIAEAVGYNNVGIFRKAFKRITGKTPSEYIG